MKKHILFPALVLVLGAFQAIASEPVSVFQFGGPGGSRIDYRIPAIATVEAGKNAGRVVAFNDYRYCHGDIGAGRIDIYQSISDDNGKTWSLPQPMLGKKGLPVANGDGWTNSRCAFGDAAVASDHETGELLLLSCGGDTNIFASRRDKPQCCYFWTSADGGDTWSEPTELTEQVLSLFDGEPESGKIDGFFFASGRILQSKTIKNGDHYRVYAALMSQNDGKTSRNWVLYSDDFGKNWKILGNAPAVLKDGDEAKVEELPDGNILFSGRGRWGNRNFNIFRYDDQASASGKWVEPVLTDMGMGKFNACNGEILIVKATDPKTGKPVDVALQTFTHSPQREKVSLAFKILRNKKDFDNPKDFEKWDGVILITDKPSAYSTLTLQKDGTVGVLFEESTHGRNYTSRYLNLGTPDEIIRK